MRSNRAGGTIQPDFSWLRFSVKLKGAWMMKGRIAVTGYWVLWTLLGVGSVGAEGSAPSGGGANPPAAEEASDQKAPADLLLPLMEVIRQYSEETGTASTKRAVLWRG